MNAIGKPVSKYDVAVKFGIITALAMMVLSTVRYALFSESFVLFMSSLPVFNLFYLFLFYLAANQQRKAQGGTITTQQGFSVIFIVILISVVVSYVYNYIYYTYIDAEVVDRITNTTLSFSERMGAPQEKLDEIAAKTEEQKNGSKGIGNQVLGFFSEIIMYSIFGLICAAIVKRKSPQQLA